MLVATGKVGAVGQPSGNVILPDTLIAISAMTTAPSGNDVVIINNVIRTLSHSGIWQRMGMFQVQAAHASQAACVDWKVPTRIASPINSPTFTANQGYTGNSGTMYLDSGYNPSLDPNVTQNSFSMGVFYWNDLTAVSTIELGNTNSSYGGRNISNLQTARVNASTSFNASTTITASGSRGAHAVSRINSTTCRFYNEGVAVGSDVANSSVGVSNENMFICARNTAGTPVSFTGRTVSAVWAGATFTDAEQLIIANALNAYMTAKGYV